MKPIFYLFLFILILSFVSSESYIVGQDVVITKSVRNNGAFDDSALCNITSTINGSVKVPFQPMLYNSASKTFTYNITKNNSLSVGNYDYDITCCSAGVCTTASDSFNLSRSGKDLGSNSIFLYLALLVFSMSLFGYFTWSGLKIEGADQVNEYEEVIAINYKKHLKWGALFMAYVCFVWLMYNAYSIAYLFLEVDFMSSILYFMWAIPLRMSPLIFIMIMSLSIWKLIKDVEKEKIIERME